MSSTKIIFCYLAVWITLSSLCIHRSNDDTAEPLTDYIPVSKSLVFAPDEMMKSVKVVILDDRSMPMVEEMETFSLQLRLPQTAVFGETAAF